MHFVADFIAKLRAINTGRAGLVLLLLLGADLAFLALHFVSLDMAAKGAHWNEFRWFSLEADRSLAEFFQYIKFGLIAALFYWLRSQGGTASYRAWVLIFGFLLVDDAISIHERAGWLLSLVVPVHMPFGLRPQDAGELFVWACAGLYLGAGLLRAYRNGPQVFRKITIDVLMFIAALAFFAAFVDMLHVALMSDAGLNRTFGIIEDCGEMLVVSSMVWYVVSLALRRGEPQGFLHDALPKPVIKALHLPPLIPPRSGHPIA